MQKPLFSDNTRYAAIGDSITHNGWYLPYVDLYCLTRFPSQKTDIFNCGINGDTADGATRRHAWDIAPHQPTVASVMFGMNDVGRELYENRKSGDDVKKERLVRIANYERNLRELVCVLQRAKTRVMVILPTIFDDTAQSNSPHYPGLDKALGAYAARAKQVADEMSCTTIDFHGPMQKLTLEQQARDPAFSLIEPDRTHPTMQGQFFMAYLFLKTLGAPAEIAKVSIDREGKVRQSTNCQITHIKKRRKGLTFRYSANALPFPLKPIEQWTDASTTWLPFANDLNREFFQITDLPTGIYQLTIDKQPIRTYTAAELHAGINLAVENNTPQAHQSHAVWKVYAKRQALVFKLRTIACVERAAFAPDHPRPTTVKKIEPLLAAYLKREVGTPWEKAIAEEVAAYRKFKGDETEMRVSVDSMLENIRALTLPEPREVTLNLVAAL